MVLWSYPHERATIFHDLAYLSCARNSPRQTLRKQASIMEQVSRCLGAEDLFSAVAAKSDSRKRPVANLCVQFSPANILSLVRRSDWGLQNPKKQSVHRSFLGESRRAPNNHTVAGASGLAAPAAGVRGRAGPSTGVPEDCQRQKSF